MEKIIIGLIIVFILVGSGFFLFFKFITKNDQEKVALRKILRVVLISILGLGLIAGSLLVIKKFFSKKEKEKSVVIKTIPGVFVQSVKNEVKPIEISANGSLIARDKVELYAEVQGIFEQSAKSFKPGIYYKKGDLLIQLNSDEYRANLQVQKSNLYQKMIALLPDLKLDYPNQFEKWNTYIANFDINKIIQPLPNFETNQEKLFISGRGIQSAYFVVKNLQERLSKYNIYAPFNGTLTMANVTKGSLVRPNQKLGTFINPNVYELEVAVSNTYSDKIKIGKSVVLKALGQDKTWTGKVVRINKIVDKKTQSNMIFIQVSGKGLKEGMYLEAKIAGNQQNLTYVLDRSLLLENNQVYIVKNDSVLTEVPVEPIHYNEKNVFVKGLNDGDRILSKPVIGAFDGKIVHIITR